MKIGYQIYSARDDAARDLTGTLKALKQMGYEAVELAGLYGKTAAEFKQALEEAGIDAISAHVPLAEIEKDMFKVISNYKLLGCKYIAVPYTDKEHRPGGAKFAHALKVIVKFGRLCREAGIQLLYHNHDFEFEKLSGIYGLDFIYSAIDDDLLKTEIDTCWAKYAGLDPAEYVKSYSGRAPVVHIKDYVGKKGEKDPYALIGMENEGKSDTDSFEFKPVGSGCQDVKALVEASRSAGAEWVIVEQDESKGISPLEAAVKSIDCLRSMGV